MDHTARNTDLIPEIAAFVEEAEGQKREFRELVEPLTEAQLSWRPEPNRWSIGEHLIHLPIANAPYLQSIDAAVAEARAHGWLGPPPYRYGALETWFARSFEPPVRMRIRTPRRLVPPGVPSRLELLERFGAVQDGLLRSMHAANGVDLGRATMQSPYLRFVRLSVGRAFLVILAHNRRHMWHARRILGNPALPRA